MNDFWDIAYLIKEFDFDGSLLQKAIRATFTNRQTSLPQQMPIALTNEFAANALVLSRWIGFINRNRIKTDTNFFVLIKKLREFFTPLIEAEAQNVTFDNHWSSNRGWQTAN